MTDLYLIAHKVRGEPAFDVAAQIECPECKGRSSQDCIDGPMFCSECDDVGCWWIIPTSGHRAYPYDFQPLFECIELADWKEMPPDAQDHYSTHAEPRRDLVALLGLIHKPLAPLPPIKRRF